MDYIPVHCPRGLCGFALFPLNFISVFQEAVPTCKTAPGKADSVSAGFGKGQHTENTLQDDRLGMGGRGGLPERWLVCRVCDMGA